MKASGAPRGPNRNRNRKLTFLPFNLSKFILVEIAIGLLFVDLFLCNALLFQGCGSLDLCIQAEIPQVFTSLGVPRF